MNATPKSAKDTRLHILHLEDNDQDALLVRANLAHDGPDCLITVVSNRDAFVQALADKHFDLILSDFNIPCFMGDEALALVREKWTDLPFIFVSGAIGEDRATEVVKQGATDYVMKEHLGRLSTAIRRAIEEADSQRQRHAAETALQEEREFLSDLFASVQDGIVVLNADMEVVRVNPTVERVFSQLIPLAGKPWTAFYAPGETLPGSVPAAQTTFLTGNAGQEYRKCLTAKGKADYNIFAFPLLERRTGTHTGVILYLRDVTHELTLHRELIQAQKMECVGQLAGSVAHDFNNILQSIIISAELLAQSIHDQDPRKVHVDDIQKTTNQAVMLTRQLLTFSRKEALTPTLVNLNSLAGNMGKMLGRLMMGGIMINLELDSEPSPVKCDPGRIEQVILNLVINARDAMPKGGEITLQTSTRTITPEEAKTRGVDWRPGTFACLAIRDTGTGITPDVMPHLFEPFFTTKPQGKGTGLGLSTVYGIVKQHNGWIDVKSKPGEGSTFSVYLPAEPSTN